MQSKILTNDNIFDVFRTETKETDLFQESRRIDYFKRRETDDPVADRVYLEIYFRAYNQQIVYKREGYDILTYLGDMGGILDLLHLSFRFLTGLFTVRLLKAAIIGSAYRI